MHATNKILIAAAAGAWLLLAGVTRAQQTPAPSTATVAPNATHKVLPNATHKVTPTTTSTTKTPAPTATTNSGGMH